MNRKPASPPSAAVRVSATIAPCSRDPRTRTDLPVDPRLQSTASFHQTAVVLPTQAKLSSTVTMQPDSATQVEQAAGSSTVENIFDRLLKDLKPVSESVAARRVANSATCSTASSESKTDAGSAFSVESGVSKAQHIVHEETDTVRKLAGSPRPATGKLDNDGSENKSEDMQLKASSQQVLSHSQKPNIAETEDSDTRHSDVHDMASCPPDDEDQHGGRDGGSKPSRRRASSQDREKSQGAGRLTVDMHDKDKDAGPVAKRMRHDELKNSDSQDSVPTDFT